MRSKAKAILFAALCGLLYLGCPLATYSTVVDQTVPLSTQTQLVVRNQNGQVQLDWTLDNAIVLHMTKRVTGPNAAECQNRIADIQVSVSDTGDRVAVTVDEPQNAGLYSYGVDVNVQLPVHLLTDIGSTNGDIAGSGFTNTMVLSTTNGNIRLTDVQADVDARTTNGTLNFERIDGSVTGETTNGEIDIEAVLPDSGFCLLTATNSPIALRIPDSTSARLHATTTNGRIYYGNLSIQGNVTPQMIDGRLGEGRGDILLGTTNSDVTITGY